MAIRIIKTKDLKWINIDNFDAAAAAFLKNNFKFHALDIQDCEQDNPHPKVDIYSSYLFAIFNFPELSANLIQANELNVFLSKNYLITIQKKKFKSLKNVFYICAKNNKIKHEFFGKSSSYLLYKILRKLYSSTDSVTHYLRRNINQLEKEIYEKNPSPSTVKDLAIIRRGILTSISILEPQRFTINTLVHAKKSFIPEELSIYFDDIHDQIEEIWTIMKNYKDIISGLQTTIESLISNKTNEVVKILTAISVALLPLTLLSGIYGMNIDKLPGAHEPLYVWGAFISLAIFIIGILYYLRRKTWL